MISLSCGLPVEYIYAADFALDICAVAVQTTGASEGSYVSWLYFVNNKNMQVGTAHSIGNPNESWLDSKGTWLTYLIMIAIGHLVILSIPVLDTATAWTITNSMHNVCVFLLLHYLKGAPFETSDQGRSRRLTHWEQINQGTQFTQTRKFFTLVPIVLFMITSFYTKYDGVHFAINAFSLTILSLVPKFPQMYKVRLFGLNKY